MEDIVTKYCNIISTILKTLNPQDVATTLQERNLLSAILSILEPLKLVVSIVKKILLWVARIVAIIKRGLIIAQVLLELYDFLIQGVEMNSGMLGQ